MGRKRYILNQRETKKALNKYGVSGVVGFIIMFAGIDIAAFSWIMYFALSLRYNTVVAISILSAFFIVAGVFLLIKGKRDINQEQKDELERITKERELQKMQERRREEEEKERHNRHLQILQKAKMSEIDKMSGVDFEDFLESIFIKLGYKVSKTKRTGDFGADLILLKKDKTIVQAKRYSKTVSLSAIQEITAAKLHYLANSAWVVTNNYFTKSAQDLAYENKIRLINRDGLAKLIIEANASDNCDDYSNEKTELELETIEKNGEYRVFDGDISQKSQDQLVFGRYEYDSKYDNYYAKSIYSIEIKINSEGQSIDSLEKIKTLIEEAESVEIRSNNNRISLHFFYSNVAQTFYSMRYLSDLFISECLKLCDKDIELLKTTKLGTQVSIPSLTRKAIILERQKRLCEAIAVCDYALSREYLDEGKSFSIRKSRLERKLK